MNGLRVARGKRTGSEDYGLVIRNRFSATSEHAADPDILSSAAPSGHTEESLCLTAAEGKSMALRKPGPMA